MKRRVSPRDRESRTRSLVAASARRRDAIAAALAPVQARARRIDGALHFMQAKAGWIGLAAGLGAGLWSRLRPPTLAGALRALASVLPLWRAVNRGRG